MSIIEKIVSVILGLLGGHLSPEEMAEKLDIRAAAKSEKLDWRHSIVDLLKLLDLESGLSSRKQLAMELGYKGDLDGSPEMNIWLHKQVMEKLASHGGTVPGSLR